MRPLLLCLVIFGCFVSLANGAPRPQREAKPQSPKPIRPVPLSPAQLIGKVVYTLGNDVWALNPQTRHNQLLYKNVAAISWSPNRDQVAFIRYNSALQGSRSQVCVMNWNGSAIHQVYADSYDDSGILWSPDGSKLLFSQLNPLIGPIVNIGFCVVGLNGGKQEYTSDTKNGRYLSPHWSRDGKRILVYDMTANTVADEALGHRPDTVLFLNGDRTEGFRGDWQNFIVDNQSHDGKWRAELQLPDDRWWYDEGNSGIFQNMIWDRGEGFVIASVEFGNKPNEFAVEGLLPRWTIDAQGATHIENVSGVWLIAGEANQQSLHLLAKDAHLIDWF